MKNSEKYQNGKIYQIVDNAYTKYYIGSTVESLSRRMSHHKTKYKQFLNGDYHYITAFDLFNEFGFHKCKIELVEQYPCKNKEELDAREGFHIRKNECVNKRVEGRSAKEWYIDNKHNVLEQTKEWKQNNPDLVKQQTSRYREKNRNKINQYYHDNKDKGKQYHEINREHIRERMHTYYQKNAEKIKTTGAVKITCPVCGSCIRKSDKSKHEKSLKHQAALQQ